MRENGESKTNKQTASNNNKPDDNTDSQPGDSYSSMESSAEEVGHFSASRDFPSADFPDRLRESSDSDSGNERTNAVAIIVGKWAMPTTVSLVLITCLSGYYLTEAAFTPVVGMIAPVVMALIMVIKEASVGKDIDPSIKERELERMERMSLNNNEKDIKITGMEIEEKLKLTGIKEQARQFELFRQSTQEFVVLLRDMNTKLATQLEKNKSTELAFGDTKIKISDGEASVYKQGKLEAGSHLSDPVTD